MRKGRLNRMELCSRKELFLTKDRKTVKMSSEGEAEVEMKVEKGEQ